MTISHYIGFDVHKKSVSYCVKTGDGTIVEEGRLRATHEALRQWAGKRPEPWHGATEATLFSGWIYDTLKPFAAKLQMGHPAQMKAIEFWGKLNDYARTHPDFMPIINKYAQHIIIHGPPQPKKK